MRTPRIIGQGTSKPAAPAEYNAGDLYYHTATRRYYEYDVTNNLWWSAPVIVSGGTHLKLAPFALGATDTPILLAVPSTHWSTQYPRCTRLGVSYYVPTTNNTSNWYKMEFLADGGPIIGTVTTWSGGPNVWANPEIDVNFSLDGRTTAYLYVTKTGTPGNPHLVPWIELRYALR